MAYPFASAYLQHVQIVRDRKYRGGPLAAVVVAVGELQQRLSKHTNKLRLLQKFPVQSQSHFVYLEKARTHNEKGTLKATVGITALELAEHALPDWHTLR